MNVRSVRRAEVLLLGHLGPAQTADWNDNSAFNVRGSEGTLYRLTPTMAPHHQALVFDTQQYPYEDCGCYQCQAARAHGHAHEVMGMSAWMPSVPAYLLGDWALAMMLVLGWSEEALREVACKDWVGDSYSPALNGGDYDGEI